MAKVSSITLRVLSIKIVRIIFAEDIRTSTALDLDNYTITPLSGGSDVTAKAVTGYDQSKSSTGFVDVVISRPTRGAEYRLAVTGIKNTINEDLVSDGVASLDGDFVAKETKVDSIFRSMSSMFDTGINSNLHFILKSISIEDETIGGQGAIETRKLGRRLITAGSSTLGTSTLGTNTLGG